MSFTQSAESANNMAQNTMQKMPESQSFMIAFMANGNCVSAARCKGLELVVAAKLD